MKVLSILMLVSAGLFIMALFIIVPVMTAGLCRDILETDFGGEDGLARVLIISAACLLCLSSCVGIAGFVFLIIFTTDVSAVDLECDQDKFSSMDTFVMLC